jgi:FkbM family methyltransferase
MTKKFSDFKKLGIPYFDFLKFRKIKDQGRYESKLFGNPVIITSPFWYLHSLEELFLDEVYKFTSERKTPYILDCGANYGFSIIYFKRLFPESEILAFEPDKKIFELLKNNLAPHNFKNIELVNAAVWKEDAQLEFASEGSLGGAIIQLGTFNMNKCIVDAKQLSPYLTYREIDFLKLDIEGAEYDVLQSCKNDLSRVKNLFIEYHSDPNKPQMLVEILEIVKAAGFRFYIKEAWKNMTHPFIEHENFFYYDMQLNIFCYR